MAERQTIETDAGVFNCYKIVADVEFWISSKLWNPTERHRLVEWVAREAGTVRAGELDKKGRLMDYVELVKIEWPGEYVSQAND